MVMAAQHVDGHDLFLSEAEIDELCRPLKQPAAQVRFLRASGLTVTVKPNGRAAVVRSHAEAILSGQGQPQSGEQMQDQQAATGGPRANVEGFLKVIQGSRKNGPQKKVQPA